jgi:pimeloyl-ACP methyl ester carboxylesterase
MTTHFFGDTAVLTGRSLRHITRSPDTIITTAVMPIAIMLLFVYVFGGAISQGSGSARYVTYLLPGILLITIASSISYAAYRLFTDLQSGIFERFLSMPIARSSVLWAHVLTSLVASLISVVVVVVVGVALLKGTDLYLAPEAFREAFAADVDPATAAVMAAAQRPYAAAAFAAAPSGPPAWKTLPCWYLLGTEDKAIPPALQRFMAERANATIVEVPASHVSFVSQPEAATQLILQAVEATSRSR